MNTKKLCTLLLASSACAMLCACSIGQPSKPSQFYILTPQVSAEQSLAPISTAQEAKKIIGVGPVRIPSYIDRPQIVLRNNHDVQIRLDEFNRWAEALADNIPRLVTDMVALHAGPTASVVQYPSASNRHADMWLTMNINRLDGALGQTATLDTWWSIVARNGDLLYTNRFTKTLPVGPDYEDLVQVESELLWLATKQAVEQMAELK